MRLKRFYLIASLFLCLILVLGCLTGCGSDSGSDSAGGTDSEPDEYADYPNGPITLIIPFGAGGEHDLAGRAMIPFMEKQGFQLVVQNVEGSSGLIGTMEVMNREADGYTILMSSPEVLAAQYASGTADQPLHEQLCYLGNFVYDAGIICVAADSPYKTLDDLIAAAKEKPGEMNWASVGSGGKNQMDALSAMKAMGIELNYVPYENASKSRAAVMGGHAAVFHAYVSGAKATIDANELLPLAVASEERVSFLPDVPTLKELGYDCVFGLTRGWDIHADTPDEIVNKFTEALKAAYDSDEAQKALLDLGANPYWMSGDEMMEYGKEQYAIYSEMFKILQ